MSDRWITRERPKIDRIACPWLIRRFVAKDAEFIYVPDEQVLEAARAVYSRGWRTITASRSSAGSCSS